MSNSSERLQVVRPDDLLVLEVECVNLVVSADGKRLERIERDSPAVLIVHLPSQHIAERAFFEFEQTLEPTGAPPTGAFAAGPSRLCFTLFPGQQGIDLSLNGLLGWWSLVPRLARNALPSYFPSQNSSL
jgi:hypothetical protein